MSDDDPQVCAYFVQQLGKELRVQVMNASRLRSECMSVEDALDALSEGRLAIVEGSSMGELRQRFKERRTQHG